MPDFNANLSLEEETHVARNSRPDIRVLSLCLQKPCPVICPSVPSSIVPKASCETLSPHFVDLTKSTEIEIALDWKWLHREQVTSFLSIVSQPERFRGFPVDEKNLKGRQLEDWTVFSPVNALLSVVYQEFALCSTYSAYKSPDASMRFAVCNNASGI
jgi:hypothetical protein